MLKYDYFLRNKQVDLWHEELLNIQLQAEYNTGQVRFEENFE